MGAKNVEGGSGDEVLERVDRDTRGSLAGVAEGGLGGVRAEAEKREGKVESEFELAKREGRRVGRSARARISAPKALFGTGENRDERRYAHGSTETSMMRFRERESPTTSKPGPMLAEVEGTLILNRLGSVGQVLDILLGSGEVVVRRVWRALSGI